MFTQQARLKLSMIGINAMNFSFLDDLVDQLLFEILIKLPVKHVYRCKCVCKRWYSLISNPYFSRQYKFSRPKYSPSQFTLLHARRTCDEDLFKHHPGFSFDFVPQTMDIWTILGSCNGLVLCGKMDSPYPYYICNPLTMEWLQIPPQSHILSLIGFTCDSKVEEFSSRTKYNVVRIPLVFDQNEFKAEIFSSDTWEWREFNVCCSRKLHTVPTDLRQPQLVSCNGVLYWLSCSRGIIAYDLYNKIDQCTILDLPEDKNTYFGNWKIGTCQDHLRLSKLMCVGDGVYALKVWELTISMTRGWRLEYNISQLRVNRIRTTERLFVIAFDAVDRDILYVSADGNGIDVFSINLKTITLESNFLSRYSPYVSPFVLPWWPTPLPTRDNVHFGMPLTY